MEICVQSGGVVEHIGIEKGYDAIAKAGFTAIDWNGTEHTLPGDRIRKLQYEGTCVFEQPLDAVLDYFAEEVAAIRKNGLTISQAHAPFPAYLPGHPEILEYMIGIYKRNIELCDAVGCKNLIIHGISLAPTDRENTRESITQLNMHLYESLIPTLLNCNVTVCLENLFTWDNGANEGVCSDADEAVWYIDTLNHNAGREVFGLCVDTGHLLLLGKDFRNYMPVLGKRIKALHIHDNDGRVDRHLAPMTGKANWVYFCESLRQIGYEGDLSFETFAQTRAALKFGEEMVQPWLDLIYIIGKNFRDRIQGL